MSALWASRPLADLATEKLKAFAQPQRLMVLSLLLARGEQSVSAIDEASGIGQPALSQQLAELRKAGMVATRRQAKQVYYSLADEVTVLCVRSIEAAFGAGEAASSAPVAPEPIRGGGERARPAAAGAAAFARILAP